MKKMLTIQPILVGVCALMLGWSAHAARGGRTPGITISAPASAQIGDTIEVIVTPVNGANLESVLFVPGQYGAVQSKAAAPWTFSYTVPDDAFGMVTLGAVATDLTDINAAYSATTDLQVGTAAALTGLSWENLETGVDGKPRPAMDLGWYKEFAHPSITGTFADGTTRNLSHPATGTVYVSSNPDIVGITEDGGIEALGQGSATVTATNGGQSVAIPVTVDFVDPVRGQITGGRGSNEDIALTYTGPVSLGTSDTPPVAPLTSTTFTLPMNTSQARFTFNNNSGVGQLGAAPGVVTWSLGKGSAACSVSFAGNELPVEHFYPTRTGTVALALPPAGGKCVVNFKIEGQPDSAADKFTITNPAPGGVR